jgi:rhodanese-related sulfurtransferase
MMKPRSIDPTQAHEKVHAGAAYLVCAYEDDDECWEILLEDAMPLSRFRPLVHRVPKGQDIIFFCAGPHDETAIERVDEFEKMGFENARFIAGGVKAWKKAGFPLAAEVAPQKTARRRAGGRR